ncbi:MAG: asparagine synthetase B [bacterium]|nr:asparagine synthetase B [bacterium]
MSGIAGIVNADHEPVDRGLLGEMTQSLAYRGPDAQNTWIGHHAGLGHAMLQTTFDMERERQPHSLDGEVWITADARIDAREELIQNLKRHASADLGGATDVDLILHAYRAWDVECLDYLLGDFAFGIWDAPKQRLFCARDHFGVRPFYYAQVGKQLIFSNNLDTIRLHPNVSATLNDLAVVNCLLFRYQPKIDITFFADIQGLRPAHRLVWENGKATISRYWTLPVEEPIRYAKEQDYIDNFLELLDRSMIDRMRTDRAGILMSGGMDSTAIAASVSEIARRSEAAFSLKAYTYVYERSRSSREKYYATRVAERLGLPIQYIAMDDAERFEGWDSPDFWLPEPIVSSALLADDKCIRDASEVDGRRVFYSGFGPDAMLWWEPSYYRNLIRDGHVGHVVEKIAGFLLHNRRLPPLTIKTAVKQWWSRLQGSALDDSDVDATIRDMLTPDVRARIDIPCKWWQFPEKPLTHPWRPRAYEQLIDPYWTLGFQELDIANVAAPVEFRFPYFDIRLVRFLLRVPVLPWCVNKILLREAMQGRLPEDVRARPKTPLRDYPEHGTADWVLAQTIPGERLAKYLGSGHQTPTDEWTPLDAPDHIIALDHWLKSYDICRLGALDSAGELPSPVQD